MSIRHAASRPEVVYKLVGLSLPCMSHVIDATADWRADLNDRGLRGDHFVLSGHPARENFSRSFTKNCGA